MDHKWIRGMIKPTSWIENSLIEQKTPTYNQLQSNAAVRFVYKMSSFYVFAFCRKTRRCLCVTEDDALFQVDLSHLDELDGIEMDVTYNRTKLVPISWFKTFPLSIQSVQLT